MDKRKKLTMIIQSDRGISDGAIFVHIAMLLFPIYMWWEGDIIYALITGIVLQIIALRGWISVDRKLTMDEFGCEVDFYGFKRHYRWEEFKVKQLIDQRNAIGHKNPYDKGVTFCTHKIRKPKWIKIGEYCSIMHPWSVVYVEFIPEKMSRWDPGEYQHSMATDEKEFLARMKEWNIELEEVAGPFE